MSISPQPGHGTVSILSPKSQNDGQVPPPAGSFARIYALPYLNENLPFVSILVEVNLLPI